MSATVEITEEEGQYRARDLETGTSGTGATRAGALAVLVARLGATEDFTEADRHVALETLAEGTRRRFEEYDVTEEDVAEAIEWARSE